MIDTLAFAERLRAGGADERLAKATAEAVAHALRESDEVRWREMATKADIAAVQSDIAALRAATQSDIAELKAATQADIAGLRASTQSDIAELRAATQSDIAELRAATQSDIAGLRASTQADIGGLKLSLSELKADLLKWVIGLLLGQTAVIAALVRLL